MEAQASQLAAHQVLVALQFQRIVLRRRRLEGIALLGQLRRPLVEGGDIAADGGAQPPSNRPNDATAAIKTVLMILSRNSVLLWVLYRHTSYSCCLIFAEAFTGSYEAYKKIHKPCFGP
jgi:hypothetical protein